MTEPNFDASKCPPTAPAPEPAAAQPTPQSVPVEFEDPAKQAEYERLYADLMAPTAQTAINPTTTPQTTPENPPALAQVQQTPLTPTLPPDPRPGARYMQNGGINLTKEEYIAEDAQIPLHPTVINTDHPEFNFMRVYLPKHLDDVSTDKRVIHSFGENRVVFFVGGGYTEQQREILIEWVPVIMDRYSELLGRKVTTPEQVLEHCQLHARGLDKAQRKQARDMERELKLERDRLRTERMQHESEVREDRRVKRELRQQQDEAFQLAYREWVEACSAYRAQVLELEQEWRKRVGAKQEAVAQWDAYVKEARDELRELRDCGTPVRPSKRDFFTG